jgi:serine/threonine protein kinase
MDLIPQFLRAKYDHVEFVDRGAYGRVYKCNRSGVTTAVKILDDLDSVSKARFHSEISIIRGLDHPNIVKVFDAGDTSGHYWYESEYANQGHFGTMYSYLFYSDLDRVNYFRQICLGVQKLHDSDPPIIHRDLKPSNILVFEEFQPQRRFILKIADFGIAAIAGDGSSLTTTGAALGTGLYMAPERVKNAKIKTFQSDIYSLGITFLEACTGYTTPSSENLSLVPDILRPMIAKMVRQHWSDRYQSVAEVLKVLNSFSFARLLLGRELAPDESNSRQIVFHVNIGRELENALEALFRSNENILERLRVFEQKLDRLGDAHDHEADTIMRVTGSVLGEIDKAEPVALLHLVERFMRAAEKTTERDHFSPTPDMWSHFLADTFNFSSYRPTKNLCLEGLAKFLVRFGTAWSRNHLYLTITRIEDPSYIEHLVVCLREVGCEDLAHILEGVPLGLGLNFDRLRAALADLR